MKDQYPAGAHPDGTGTPALPSPEQLPLEIFMGILDIKETLREKHQADAEAICIDAILSAAEQYCQANPDKARTALDFLQHIIAATKGTAAERTATRSRLILQRLSHADGEAHAKEGSATTAQQVLLFYYIFHALGINWSNSYKSDWARLLGWLFGRGEQSIREKLYFKFDDPSTRSNFRILLGHIEPLLPSIATQIRRDMSTDE